MRAYRKLVTVELTHEYYPSGKLTEKDLKLFVLPDTRKILDNYRLILRQSENTFEIIQECVKDDKGIEAFVKIDSQLNFNFVLKQQNKQFFNFTETKYPDMRREVFYFTNFRKSEIKEKGTLAKAEKISSADLIKIADLEDQSVVKMGGVIAQISISINELINKTIESEKPFEYSLSFDARLVFWQYRILKKYNSINKTVIVDDLKLIKFNEIKELSAEEEEKVFVSDKKMALKLVNNNIFKLISSNGRQGIDKTLREKLPYPKISDLKKHPTIENEFIATVNVFI